VTGQLKSHLGGDLAGHLANVPAAGHLQAQRRAAPHRTDLIAAARTHNWYYAWA
jgi:hypothetical protein